jgi:hypothetical protein
LRWESEALRANVERATGQTLADPAALFAATRALKDKKDYKSITDDQLPLT